MKKPTEMKLTEEQKIMKYRNGDYTFPDPPVSHAHWSESAWIKYIDNYGTWKLTEIKSLHIVGKRWFQKSYGNTYHSVLIYVNDEKIYCPFAYGYDNQFLQTAEELLKKAGYDLKLEEHESLSFWVAMERIGGTYTVYDVPRKKDL